MSLASIRMDKIESDLNEFGRLRQKHSKKSVLITFDLRTIVAVVHGNIRSGLTYTEIGS